MRPYWYTWILVALVVLILTCWTWQVVLTSWYSATLQSTKGLVISGKLAYNRTNGEFRLESPETDGKSALQGILSPLPESTACPGHPGPGVCMEMANHSRLTIKTETSDTLTCHTISWSVLSGNFSPRDCFFIGDSHWYGGAEMFNQRWPIERGSQYHMFPFLPGGDMARPYHEDILERYWLSSKGIVIKADDEIPLFVNWNADGNGMFCFISQLSWPYRNIEDTKPHLKYHICQGENMKSTHVAASAIFFPKPRALVDTRMLVSPIWSTWVKHGKDVNQSKVLAMADEIVQNGYTYSHLEIDNMFTSSHGAVDFDEKKFPNASGMIATLKSMGFRVAAWFHPYVNVDSPVFLEAMENNYLVKDSSRQVPALAMFWTGVAGLLDVTNQKATRWFTRRLQKFKDRYNIDSFKFDAGGAFQFPRQFTTHLPIKSTAYFTTKYVEMCSQFGPMVEIRVGYKNQDQPIFFRFQDMFSHWGFENGLKSIIPRMLQFGLIGYLFCIPDMIGGNASYGLYPGKELFIRWMQVSAFMPAWQFSITPGQYDSETVRIAKHMMAVRESFVKPHLLKAAQEAVDSGAPIARPLWWISPDDVIAQTTESQFLLGNDVLVAPILQKGATARDVYVPAGTWKDQNTHILYEGPLWLINYSIPLDKIAYFQRTLKEHI